MAQLRMLQRVVSQIRGAPVLHRVAAARLQYASDATGQAEPQAPHASGAVFNTAGTEVLAADPGPQAATPAAVTPPAQPLAGARLQPAAAVTPAAAAKAAEAVAAAEAVRAAEAAGATPAAAEAAAQQADGADTGTTAPGAQGAADAAGSDTASAEFDPGELSEEQRDVLATIVREALASEEAVRQLVRAQRAVLGGRRPDLGAAAGQDAAAAEPLRRLAPALRARPSALSPLWGLTGAAAGVAAGIAPRKVADAIRAGAAEALTERYTGHLRRIAGLGLSDSPAAEALRTSLRTLRDMPRTPEDAPLIPDLISSIMNQRPPRNMSLPEGIGGVTKLGFQALFAATSHI